MHLPILVNNKYVCFSIIFVWPARVERGVLGVLRTVLLPPALRGGGLLLLQSLLPPRHRQVLLLRGGHRGLQHRLDLPPLLPVVQV